MHVSTRAAWTTPRGAGLVEGRVESRCAVLYGAVVQNPPLRVRAPHTYLSPAQSFIAEVRSKATTWDSGMNSKFDGMTLKQAKRLMGTKRSAARRAQLPNNPLKTLPASAIPASFNASANWPAAWQIGHVRDQSDCGSCWAFASTESFNDRIAIAYNYTSLVSPQATASCCNSAGGCSGSNGCDGGFTEDAWGYFSKTGIPTGGDNPSVGSGSSCFPYQLAMCDHHEGGPYPACPSICSPGECSTPVCPKACTETKYNKAWAADLSKAKKEYRINSIADAQTQIMTNGPITSSFSVYADFLTYKSGVYTHVTGADLGGHAVKVIGWVSLELLLRPLLASHVRSPPPLRPLSSGHGGRHGLLAGGEQLE